MNSGTWLIALVVHACLLPSGAAPARPLLLGLEPDTGPRDGGTRVELSIFGAAELSKAVHVILRNAGGPDWRLPSSTQASEGRQSSKPFKVSLRSTLQQSDEHGKFFVMPNLTEIAPEAVALLVSIDASEPASTSRPSSVGSTNAMPATGGPSWEVLREYQSRRRSSSAATPSSSTGPRQSSLMSQVARPMLFRLSEPLAFLAPEAVQPCCELKISGGEDLVIWGAVPATAAAGGQAVVRFRGANHLRYAQAVLEISDDLGAPMEKPQQRPGDVSPEHGLGMSPDGQPYSNVDDDDEADEDEEWRHAPEAWKLRVVTPPWPKAEGKIVLETSWNSQQFIPYRLPLRFVEEKSLFGDVSEGISEEVQGKGADMSHVTIVDDEGDSFVLSRGRDVSFLQQDMRLIHDLFLLMVAASTGAVLAVMMRTPTIIGFLIGGVVVGPGGLNLISELVQVESVAELGICMLLLCLGLDLMWEDLLSNTRAALAGILAMGLLCCLIVFFADFVAETPRNEALCIGLFAALSSTPMSLRAIAPAASSPAAATETGILLSILVTQDVVFAGLLALFPGLFEGSNTHGSASQAGPRRTTPQDGAPADAKEPDLTDVSKFQAFHVPVPRIASFVVVAQVCAATLVGLRWLSIARIALSIRAWALSALLRIDDELFALTVLSVTFLISYVTDQLGLSLELGSFAAGLLLRSFSAEAAERALQQLGSLRDTFTALFFASIGLVVNAKLLVENFLAVFSVVIFLFILKVLTAFLPLWLLTRESSPTPAVTAFRISFILAHVSEFGFVLAARGSAWGILPKHVYLLVIGANALSLFLAPWQFRALEWLAPRGDSGTSAQVLPIRSRSPHRPPVDDGLQRAKDTPTSSGQLRSFGISDHEAVGPSE